MIPGDIADVPTLNSLNKPQKRALILRDQLRYLEPTHLDSYLDGVTADEPPTYKHVSGAVYPQLAQVAIKDEATRFDLGNVQFPEEGGATYRAYLTVEDERFEMRTVDPLPKGDAELASVCIHRFVAENMFPLFKTKYKAIHARMEKINEARRVAYNMLDHPPARFEDGETVARLNPPMSKAIEDASRDGNSRKRKEIVKHASNKRQRVGLETIPDKVKSETFNTIPIQIKVDLFNSMIKTAFPNFDNLIIASWNVVSVYANVGSDFPELHRAVVELKGALEEFESSYAPSRTKSGKSRKEATPAQQTGSSRSRTSTPVREGRATPVSATRSNDVTANQAKKQNNSVPDQQYLKDDDNVQHQMPPPRVLQASQQQCKEGTNKEERQSEPSAPTQTDGVSPRAQAVSRHAPEGNLITSGSTRSSTPSLPNEQHLLLPQERVRKIRDRSAEPFSYERLQAPGSELMRKRQEYTASLFKANRNSTSAALGHHSRHDEEDGHYQDDYDRDHVYERRSSGSVGGHGQTNGASLGNSVLGAKKQNGGVPVAPMMPMRKDGGASGGNITGRRGH